MKSKKEILEQYEAISRAALGFTPPEESSSDIGKLEELARLAGAAHALQSLAWVLDLPKLGDEKPLDFIVSMRCVKQGMAKVEK